METQLANLLTLNIIFLSALTGVFLIVLIVVLLLLRKTLIRAQKAINDVESAAMVPIDSAKHVFSDLESFVGAFSNMFKLLAKRKKR